MMGMGLLIVAIIVYIIITCAVVDNRCTTYKCRDDFSEVDTNTRDATTKDVWIGLCWPVLLIWVLLKTIVFILNDIVLCLGLLIGFKYKSTTVYKNIRDWAIKDD